MEKSERMYDNSEMNDFSEMYDKSAMFDSSTMNDFSEMHDYSKMHGSSSMHDYSEMWDHSSMWDHSRMTGTSKLKGYGKIAQYHKITAGTVNYDATKRENLHKLIANSLNIGVVNGILRAFKRVKCTDDENVFLSEWDTTFEYVIGEECIAPEVDEDPTIPCGKGLHASNYNYYDLMDSDNSAIIAIDIHIDDIICCQDGKVRFRKGMVVGCCDRNIKK